MQTILMQVTSVKPILEFIYDNKTIPVMEFIYKHHVSPNNVASPKKIEEIKKYIESRFWDITKPGKGFYGEEITYTYGKDTEGYYIDTEGHIQIGRDGDINICSPNDFFEERIKKYNRIDNADCPIFRWRNHEGTLVIASDLQNFNSLEGLPDTLDEIYFKEGVGRQSKSILLGKRTINKIHLINVGKINLTGAPIVNEITWCGCYGRKPVTTFNCKNMHK